MATEKQIRARKRNWAKAQIVGINSNMFRLSRQDFITNSESKKMARIYTLTREMLDHWKPRPPKVK